MEMVEKEGNQMESKTSKERWIYATAELYGVSVKNIHAILDQCKEFYGNKLDFEQQKIYVRGVLDKVAPMKYFQFTGKAFVDWSPKHSPNLPWMDYIPNWFRFFYETDRDCYVKKAEGWVLGKDENGNLIYDNQEIIVFKFLKISVGKGDYIVNAGKHGIVPVAKDFFESVYQKDESILYNCLSHF